MTSHADRRAAARKRDDRAAAMMRDGATDEAVSAETGLDAAGCKRLRRHFGLALAVKPEPVPRPTISPRVMREECVRHLGGSLVGRVAPSFDPVELQRLYAALRLVLLDAGDLVSVVEDRFAEVRAQQAAALARRVA